MLVPGVLSLYCFQCITNTGPRFGPGAGLWWELGVCEAIMCCDVLEIITFIDGCWNTIFNKLYFSVRQFASRTSGLVAKIHFFAIPPFANVKVNVKNSTFCLHHLQLANQQTAVLSAWITNALPSQCVKTATTNTFTLPAIPQR